MYSLLPVVCLLLAWTKEAGALDPTLPFMEYLDTDYLVFLNWGFDDLKGTITFKLVVNTTGWVSFGLSPNGGMSGSDIIIGGRTSSGTYFTDRYATGNFMPVVDAQQSYTLLSMEESDGQTIMTVRRSIQTCDDQDLLITAQPIKIIYAYGTTDDIAYHGEKRGTKEINLLNYMPKTTPPNSKYLDAKVDNILLPAIPTYYHCKVMKFPVLSTTHHVYQIEPEIDKPGFVHHMLLYQCPPTVTETYDNSCYMGDAGDDCFGVVASWGVGGGAYELPEDLGIPIGGVDGDTLYRLEIHYDNPQSKAGIRDSSGLRLYYTDQLRKHTVGVLTTGILPLAQLTYIIPPKATQFRSYGTCNTTLFSRFVNHAPDLHVFGVLLHTHLAGRKVRVGLFRNGTQIDFIGLDENYDFNFQQAVSLGNIKTIKPGDEIIVECTYSTANRTKITTMGLGTTDEMCLAFLVYYPAINITSCTSHPVPTDAMSTDDKTSVLPSDPDAIAQYETLLKTIPQLHMITDDYNNFSVYQNGFVREMMDTPSVTCQGSNASSRLFIFWIGNPAGIILWLLWIAIM